MKKLGEVESFGGIDADTDMLLQQCFQDHEAYINAVNHSRPFVLGRKGAGKTAIFKKIIGTHSHDVFAEGHAFAEYPWNHHSVQELAGVPQELRYVESWTYLILLAVSRILVNQDESQPWNSTVNEELGRLRRFIVDSYGTATPDVSQVFTPTHKLRIVPNLSVGAGLVNTGVDLEKMPLSDLPRVITEVNINISKAVVSSLNPELHYYICFDELDRAFQPSEPSYFQMLIGLLLSAKIVNQRAKADGKKLSVLVFLRDDIYHLLKFEDKNKITESLVSLIEWDSKSTKWTLRNLMEKRFTAVLGDDEEVTWGAVFDEQKEMPGHQSKYQHVLDRTFRRPRDIIKFTNEILTAYKSRGKSDSRFSNEDINSARSAYSQYLLQELEDEVHKHLPDYERYLDVLRDIGAAQFTRDQLDRAFGKKKDLFSRPIDPLAILKQLFEFSVVAYQRTGGVGGGSAYVWKYLDPRARFDDTATNFRVHPGLVEALNLKKYKLDKQG